MEKYKHGSSRDLHRLRVTFKKVYENIVIIKDKYNPEKPTASKYMLHLVIYFVDSNPHFWREWSRESGLSKIMCLLAVQTIS